MNCYSSGGGGDGGREWADSFESELACVTLPEHWHLLALLRSTPEGTPLSFRVSWRLFFVVRQ